MPADERPQVLYVSVDPSARERFAQAFSQRLRVLTAPGAIEALSVLAAQEDDVAVVLAEAEAGLALLEEARRRHPEVQRLLLLKDPSPEMLLAAINRAQVSECVTMPCAPLELAAVLEGALRRRRLERLQRKVEAGLAQSAHLAGVGQIAASVAHELMNPVSYLAQNLEALRRELEVVSGFAASKLGKKPDPAVREALDDLPALLKDLESGMQHVRRVASRVQAQARGEEAERECDVAEVAAFAARMTRATIGRTARVQVRGPEALRVRSGPVGLTQVLVNLIVNASHGIAQTQRTGTVQVTWSARGDEAVIEVADDGCGIASANLERVFEPMFTTKPAGAGTGLGLPMARQLIRDRGGELTLESEVGKGTVVRLTLPVA